MIALLLVVLVSFASAAKVPPITGNCLNCTFKRTSSSSFEWLQGKFQFSITPNEGNYKVSSVEVKALCPFDSADAHFNVYQSLSYSTVSDMENTYEAALPSDDKCSEVKVEAKAERFYTITNTAEVAIDGIVKLSIMSSSDIIHSEFVYSAREGDDIYIFGHILDGAYYDVDSVWYCLSPNCADSAKIKVSTSTAGFYFTMPASDVWFGATYKRSMYAIIPKESPHCSLSVSSASAYPDSIVTLKVVPDPGYEVDSVWYCTTSICSASEKKKITVSSGSYTFMMPITKAWVGVAVKAISYRVTNTKVTNGSLSVSKTNANVGNTITVTPSANTGYEVDSVWYCTKENCSASEKKKITVSSGSYTFTMPASNVWVGATFKAKSYTITFKFGSKTETSQVKYGETPKEPSSFKCSANTAEYAYSCKWDKAFAKVTGEATYTFIESKTKNSYVVKAAVNDAEMGSVSGLSETGKYEYGTEVKLTAVAKTGYEFSNWNDDVKTAERTIKVTGNVTYTATFKAKLYTITFVYVENGETINEEIESVEYGAVPTAPESFVCPDNTAEYTYKCAWEKDFAAVIGEDTYTFNMSKTKKKYTVTFKFGDEIVTEDVAYGDEPTAPESFVCPDNTAEYTYKCAWDNVIVPVEEDATYEYLKFEDKNSYIVEVAVNDAEMGSVSGLSETGVYFYGTEVKLTAEAKTGYEFSNWNDDVKTAERTIKVTGNVTYTATFKAKLYTITFVYVENGETINEEIESVEYGAVPTAPESFVCPDNTAEYTYKCAWDNVIVPVEEDATYEYLKFEDKNSYIVEVAVNDAEMGSVSGLSETGVYFYGTEVKLTAEAKTGYEFSNWNDDVKTAERTITVTGDMTYTATFKAIESSSSEGVSSSSVESSSSEGVSSSSVESSSSEEDPTSSEVASSSSEGESSSGVESSDSKFSSSSTKITSSSSAKAKSSSSSVKAKSSSSKRDDDKSSSSSVKAKSSSSKGSKDAIVAMAQMPMFSVTTIGRDLQIAGARVGAAYAILDMQGRVINFGRVESSNFNMTVARAGTFMVRVGNETRIVRVK